MRKVLKISVIAIILSLVFAVNAQVNKVDASSTNEELIAKLMRENEDNPESIKYLVTDRFISRVMPGTKVEKFKENFSKGEEVKVYKDKTCQEEVKEGYVYSGMYAKYESNGRIFKIAVIGDIESNDKQENNIEGDGILNQIELTRIIRDYVKTEGWEIKEEEEKQSADVTCDKNVDTKDIKAVIKYIVYDGLDVPEVKKVEAPKVEIIEGRKNAKGEYVNSTKIKITQVNKEDETLKTVYKITGSKTEEYKEINGTEEVIELKGRGTYKVTAYTYGTLENKSKGANEIIQMTEEYTVTFYDEDGTTVLGTSTVDYGTNASYTGEVPKKELSEKKFAFDGWDRPEDLKNVTENRSVKATFSEVPVDGNYELIFKDDFNDVDTNTWRLRNDGEEKLGGINKAENIKTEDGTLKIEFGKDDEGNYTGGGIISKQLFGYGYYEIEAKLFNKGGGFHSSFWLMGGSKNKNYSDDMNQYLPEKNLVIEIDGFEFDSNKPENINFNMFYKIGSFYGNKYGTKVESLNDDKFHKFGFEWLPDKVNYYMDGKLMHTKNSDFYAQQSLWLTGLANTLLSGKPTDSILPGYTQIKYIKYYAQRLEGVNLIGSSEFEYNDNIDFDSENKVDLQLPTSFCESGDTECSFIEKVDDAYAGRYVLAHRSLNNKDYKVDTYQKIYNIPNGNYELSLWVKSGGTHKNKKAVVITQDENGREISIDKDIPTTENEWIQLKIENVNVKNNQAIVKFSSDANSDGWIQIDNPEFYSTSGVKVTKALSFNNSTRTGDYIGEAYYNTRSKEFATSKGWVESGIRGSKRSSMYKQQIDENDYAQWNIKTNSGGTYALQYYNIESNNTVISQKVEVKVNNEVKYTYETGNTSGWKTLGIIDFQAGDEVTVRTSELDNSTTKILRTDSIRLIEPKKENRIKYSDTIIMSTKQNSAFIHGVRNDINNIPSPKAKNGTIYIPYEFIKQYISVNGELEQYTTKFGDIKYISEEDIADHTDYKISLIDNQYVIVHSKETVVLEKMKDNLNQIF